jgi:hypothetical protein
MNGAARQRRTEALTGTIGAHRLGTVSMISAWSMPCRYIDVMPTLLWPSWRWMTISGTASCAIPTA